MDARASSSNQNSKSFAAVDATIPKCLENNTKVQPNELKLKVNREKLFLLFSLHASIRASWTINTGESPEWKS